MSKRDQTVTQPAKYNQETTQQRLLTVAAIIEICQNRHFQGIVLIERGHPPLGKALPGGKVEVNETLEEAVRREMDEEVSLSLQDLHQFHVYSDPNYAVEVVYLARAYLNPHPGDDASQAWVSSIEEIPWNQLAFDHAKVLRDYVAYRGGGDRTRTG